jgi:hypothetical protein
MSHGRIEVWLPLSDRIESVTKKKKAGQKVQKQERPLTVADLLEMQRLQPVQRPPLYVLRHIDVSMLPCGFIVQ